MANFPRCASRHKANVEARKEKKLRQSNKKEQEKSRSEVGEEKGKREESLEPNMSMDLENEQWTTSSSESRLESHDEDEASDIYVDESQDHTKGFFFFFFF